MALQVKAVCMGIPEQVQEYIAEGLSSSFGAGNYTIITPSNDSEANLSAADAVRDTRVVVVVYAISNDAYLDGKSGNAIKNTGKYYKYTGDDQGLVSWINDKLGSKVEVKVSAPVINNYDVGYQPSSISTNYSTGVDAGLENIELKAQIRQLEETLSGIKRQYTLQQGVLADVKSDLDRVNTALVGKDQEIARLNNLLQDEKNTSSSARAELEGVNRQLVEANSGIYDQQQKTQGIQSQLVASQEYSRSLESKLNELQAVQSSYQSSQVALGKMTSERDEALRALQETKNQVSKISAEKEKYEKRLSDADKSLTILNQSRLNESKATVSIDRTNWAFLASKSTARESVLLPKYSGNIAQHVMVLASGAEGDNQFVAQYLRSKILLGYKLRRLSGDDAFSLGHFTQSKEVLLVELSTDTYMDYYMHAMGVKLSESKGISWFVNGGNITDFCVAAQPGMKVLSLGLGYVNEAWLMNINWEKRLEELDTSGYNVVISVGCLGSHIRRMLFKRLCQVAVGNAVISRGIKISMRSTLANLGGLFRDNMPETWMKVNWHIMNPDSKVLDNCKKLLKDSVTVYKEESEKDGKSNLWIATQVGTGENHGA